MQLRDYQVEAIVNVFIKFGLHPAGPDDELVVDRFRKICGDGCGDRFGKNPPNGRSSENVAEGANNDDFPPF
jgi:hypothetical protein